MPYYTLLQHCISEHAHDLLVEAPIADITWLAHTCVCNIQDPTTEQ